MTLHPATEDDVYNLRLYDGSYDAIAQRIGDAQDVVANWSLVGVLGVERPRRAVLVERSSLAVAFVEGDGEHFGRVRLPTAEEVTEAERAFGLHWA